MQKESARMVKARCRFRIASASAGVLNFSLIFDAMPAILMTATRRHWILSVIFFNDYHTYAGISFLGSEAKMPHAPRARRRRHFHADDAGFH